MHWQYSTLPSILQFGFALIGLFAATVVYDKRKGRGPIIVAAIFAVGFVLPFFSDLILYRMPVSLAHLADVLIPNNRFGLLFYIILTVAPWLYFWPIAYAWFATPPTKAKRRK